MNREYINEISEKIGLDEEIVKSVNEFLDIKSIFVESISNQEKAGGHLAILAKEMKKYGDKKYIFALCVILSMSERTLEKYKKLGIPEEIFIETMKDIKVWCDNCKQKNNIPGIEEIMWINNHLDANLFKLGRLQFQFTKVILPHFIRWRVRRKSPVRFNDNAIFVHIPQGDKLTKDQCDKSFEMANDFFATYFPKYDYSYYVCESWLLYPENRNFMKKDSNILAFADRFNILGYTSLSNQGYERIWDGRKAVAMDYKENTSLQRSAKEYITNGGRLGTAYGIIKK